MAIPNPILRTVFLLAAVLCVASGFAQGKFTVNGRLKIEGADLSGARAVVYKDGIKERTITANLAKFALDLDLNASYVISFEKAGFVSKKLSFNTRVPAEAISNGFTPFDYAVSLFKQYDDISIVVFNQPVGVIRYENGIGDFDYDTDYTKSIQSQLQDVVSQVEKKQKAESQGEAERQKRAAEGEKAKAKADAEAKKQQEAQKAAEAKALADAEKERAAKEAADAKAQTAAKKQEEEQAKAEQARVEAERKAAEKLAVEARKEQATPKAVPPAVVNTGPAPFPKQAAERTVPRPPPFVPVKNTLAAKPVEGGDQRRSSEPVIMEEEPRMAQAKAALGDEQAPDPNAADTEVTRQEELVVDVNKVTTVVRLESEGTIMEYRKVVHRWGGVFYFKNGDACSQLVYSSEAFGEQLAGATPRSKLD